MAGRSGATTALATDTGIAGITANIGTSTTHCRRTTTRRNRGDNFSTTTPPQRGWLASVPHGRRHTVNDVTRPPGITLSHTVSDMVPSIAIPSCFSLSKFDMPNKFPLSKCNTTVISSTSSLLDVMYGSSGRWRQW